MMKNRIILFALVLLSINTFGQRRGGSYRPSPSHHTTPIETPTPRPHNNEGFGRAGESSNSSSGNSYEAFSHSDRISAVKHVAFWGAMKSRLSSESFEQIKSKHTEFEVAFKDGEYTILHCGEVSTNEFEVTETNNTIVVTSISGNKRKNAEFVFDETVWKSGKKIIADNIRLKVLAKNGIKYSIEKVIVENGGIRYMANLKEGIWFEPTKSDVTVITRNLNREFNKGLTKIISVVNDFKTNEALKSELGANSTNCKSKDELLRRLNEQEEGSTVFIVGHHENGKFVTYDEAGNFAYEFSASEVNQVSKDKNINIFPLGCKTAFSELNQGSNIDLNSVVLSKALIKAIKTSNTFGDLLKNISTAEPSLKFLVEDNSFGAVKVEVFQDKNWRTRVNSNSQQDSTQQERDYARFVKTIKINKYGGGYIFAISENRKESEGSTTFESPTKSTEYKSDEDKFGWKLIKYGFIGILVFGFISKIISFADDAQKVGCTSIVSMLILLCIICMAIGTCMNCAN